MSNYHGCKEEVRNLVPHYLIDITYKIVAEAITFRIIAIVPNGNKLLFQIIFIFSDWILIEQIIASPHRFCVGGNKFSKTSTRGSEWVTGTWVRKHRCKNFLGMWTPLKIFSHTCWNIQVRENSASFLERQNPKEFKEIYIKRCIPEANLEWQGW